MSIKVIIDSSILLKYGGDEIVLEIFGQTIKECIESIIQKHPDLREDLFDEDGKLYSDALFTVNGESVLVDVEERETKEGDEIKVIRYAGG